MTATTLFINNRTQAVRMPAELRMPSDIKRVNVRALGADRIISPLNQCWDSFFLHTPAVSDDFMAERANQTQPEREAF